MYNAFFHLNRRPFDICPDPSMFYATPQHERALVGLSDGIRSAKGFMILTGELGTGKTLVVRCVQELLDPNRVSYAYVFDPLLPSNQFLSYLAADLGLVPRPEVKSDLLIHLSRLLIEQSQRGRKTVLVVEEAHHLSPAVLEEIRILTNLETPAGKLLQILLVGQPELTKKLEASELRQLKQRITCWFRLNVFSPSETSSYVRHRLKLAGDEGGELFSRDSLERIYRYSGGVPRLINTLCDNALMQAYLVAQERITPELVDAAAAGLAIAEAEQVCTSCDPIASENEDARCAEVPAGVDASTSVESSELGEGPR